MHVLFVSLLCVRFLCYADVYNIVEAAVISKVCLEVVQRVLLQRDRRDASKQRLL
jgi:hypothetical protein